MKVTVEPNCRTELPMSAYAKQKFINYSLQSQNVKLRAPSRDFQQLLVLREPSSPSTKPPTATDFLQYISTADGSGFGIALAVSEYHYFVGLIATPE